jgi:hypothetical protein
VGGRGLADGPRQSMCRLVKKAEDLCFGRWGVTAIRLFAAQWSRRRVCVDYTFSSAITGRKHTVRVAPCCTGRPGLGRERKEELGEQSGIGSWIEHQIPPIERLESRDLCAHRVSAAEQRHQGEEPIRARRGLARDDAFLFVDRRDLNTRKGAALFVGEFALDLRALRPRRRGNQPGRGEGAAGIPIRAMASLRDQRSRRLSPRCLQLDCSIDDDPSRLLIGAIHIRLFTSGSTRAISKWRYGCRIGTRLIRPSR